MNNSKVNEVLQEDIVLAKGREFLRECFKLYYYQRCLWDRYHAKYGNEFERKFALMKLTKICKEIFPDITEDMVKICLAHYNQCFRQEFQKFNIFKIVPAIWYYEDLYFLNSVPTYLDMQNKKNLPMPEKDSLLAVKNTEDKDKFEILVEELRTLSTEQYNCVETIISLIKLAEMKEICPDITQDLVRITLQHYNKCFRVEFDNVHCYKRTPNPNIWYYEDLYFLASLSQYLDKQKRKNLPMPEKDSLLAVKNTEDKDKFEILVEELRTLSTEQYNCVETIISLIKLAEMKPMPEKDSLLEIKNTEDKDKFEILVEELRSLSTEQYSCVENIINLIKLAKKKDQHLRLQQGIYESITLAMAQGFLRDFFALYKSLPCLWHKNDPSYKDKFHRELAMIKLTKMYRELSPDATQVTVRRELVTFKSCLHKEHRRRIEALKTGLSADSELWYYEDLSFLLHSNAPKPAAIQKAKNLTQSKIDFKERILTPRCLNENNSTPVRIYKKVPAAKNTDSKDKFDLLAEKLRSLPTEQFSYIENILTNIFKFAEYENQEWIRTSSTTTSRQKNPKPTIANIKTVQSKNFGSQDVRSRTFGTQATSTPTTSNGSFRSNYPNINYQLTRSPLASSIIIRRPEGPNPVFQSTKTAHTKTIGTQATSMRLTLNIPRRSVYPNIIDNQLLTRSSATITSRQETPTSKPIHINTKTVQSKTAGARDVQSESIDTKATSVQTDSNELCEPSSPNMFTQYTTCSQASVNLQNLIYLC